MNTNRAAFWSAFPSTEVNRDIPTTLPNKVLQTSHGDVAGHMGVRKTYDRILRYFFLATFKAGCSSVY
jgi:hypothetical protein